MNFFKYLVHKIICRNLYQREMWNVVTMNYGIVGREYIVSECYYCGYQKKLD